MTRSSSPIHITLDPASDLGRALADADAGPIELESNGVRYTVIRVTTDEQRQEAATAFRLALRKSAGMLQGVDTKKLKEDLRAQRA